MLLDILLSMLDIIFLAALLLIIRFYMQPGFAGKFYFLPAWLANRNSVWLIAGFLLLFGIKNLCGFLAASSNFNFTGQVACRISRNNLHSYQQAAYSEFVHIDSSVHIRNICYRPFEFAQYILSGFQQAVTQLVLMFMTVIAIIVFNAKIFLLLLVLLLPPVVIVFRLIKKSIAAQKKDIQENNELSFKYILDALKAYMESNLYQRNDFFLDRFMAVRQRFSKALFHSLALQSMPARIIEVFAVLGLFILIVIASYTGHNNNNMLLTIGAFMAAAYKIIPGIVKLININGQMKAYESSLYDLKQNKTNDNAITAMPPTGLFPIQLNNIDFKYGERPVLRHFCMTVNRGDFIGITGESGKGKTTLLHILLGFLPADNGQIFFNDHPAGSESTRQYWPQIAYVRQQSFFIHDTILRNIILAEEQYDPELLSPALHISGLGQLLAQFPEGLEKLVTENGKNISGGQQQRICIARALYKNAGLILLDEPFNELDEAATRSLLQHFREMAANGKAVVMISHDKKSLSYCNKIISLDA